MTASTFALATIIIAGLVTQALRFLPFFVFGENRRTPAYIIWLGEVLPYAIMAMLCVYCLKEVNFEDTAGWAPSAVAVAVVALLQMWRRNSLLSIGAGTAAYMIMVQMVFV